MAEVKGKIVSKSIGPRGCSVTYQCSCSYQITFSQEEVKRCPGCRETYQMRVIIGKATERGAIS